jgi:hypothetical protein
MILQSLHTDMFRHDSAIFRKKIRNLKPFILYSIASINFITLVILLPIPVSMLIYYVNFPVESKTLTLFRMKLTKTEEKHNRNWALSTSLHHYGLNLGPLKISPPLWTQTGSSQHLYTITDPNWVLSTSVHHYGLKLGLLNISTPLRTQTGSSRHLYTITDSNRVLSTSLHHYGHK